MRRSMDAFGEALQAYRDGSREPFFLVDKKGNAYEHPLSKYFRPPRGFSRIERRMIRMARGRILDVGCGPGTHLPSLSKRGVALGIDISPTVVRLARERGNRNCRVADIYGFSPRAKFDTIVLFENNLGMGGTMSGVKRLLRKLATILAPGGSILTNANIADEPYFTAELTPTYRGVRGKAFKWISLSESTLMELCATTGLHADVADSEGRERLIVIKKKALRRAPRSATLKNDRPSP